MPKEAKFLSLVVIAGLLSLTDQAASPEDAVHAASLYVQALDLCQSGDTSRCEQMLTNSLSHDQNQALAWYNRGHALRGLRRWAEASESYSNVMKCTRAYAGSDEAMPVWLHREAGVLSGKMRIEEGDWNGAILAFERTHTAFPDSSEALFRLLYLQHFACNFTNREQLLHLAQEMLTVEINATGGSSMTPSQALMLLDGPDLVHIATVYARGHSNAGRQAADPLGPWQWDLESAVPDDFSVHAVAAFTHLHLLQIDGRLRVGYISKDFGFSSVGQLLPRLFSAHNRRRFNAFAYALNPTDQTENRQQLEESIEAWRDHQQSSPLAIAESINNDGINIIIDLGGHFNVRAQVALSLQPCAVAVNYLSWLSTSSAPYIQYFLSDRVVTPVEYAEADFSESLAFLPYSYQVNSNRYTFQNMHYNPKARYTLLHPPHQNAIPPDAPFNDDALIFANFNQLFKVGKDSFLAWTRILKATPNSVLAMLNISDAPEGARGLQWEFGKEGVSRARLLFSPFCVSKKDFLTLSAGADLFLDNFFYNAGTTGGDVLFSGVPVVSSPGRRTLARMGASLADALDFTTLLTRNADDYVDTAIRLGNDRLMLSRLKQQLDGKLRSAHLFDVDRWVYGYEMLLLTLWDTAVSLPHTLQHPNKPYRVVASRAGRLR